jgi:hypothetical protein
MLKGYNDGVARYTVKVGMLLVSFFLEESAKSVKWYSLRQELPCILGSVKVKLYKVWPNILVKLSTTMKPNTYNMKIYFITNIMIFILYYKYG